MLLVRLLLLALMALKSVSALHVKSVHVYAQHNAKKSNTQKFRTVSGAANSDLILRRGNTFTVTALLEEYRDWLVYRFGGPVQCAHPGRSRQ